ncbi:hypothetical protein [Oceanobacter mangrovi]|uniref:hypothetical protein n=1 Tax=Oceanobacter mangrovi TaxID=2862510 RepID=UPI001C8E3091|nr:hypothetical protein [Oceanobacter mangrovi]
MAWRQTLSGLHDMINQLPEGWLESLQAGDQALSAGFPACASEHYLDALDQGYDLLEQSSAIACPDSLYEQSLLGVVTPLLNLVESYLAEERAEMAMVRLNRCISLLMSEKSPQGSLYRNQCVDQLLALAGEQCLQLMPEVQHTRPDMLPMLVLLERQSHGGTITIH